LEAAEWLRVEGQAKMRLGAKGGELLISEGAVLEAGDTLAFQSAKIEGELRCEKLIIEGAVWIGPRARVVVERIVFGEMTLESGGRLSGFGEVKTPAVETESELPLGEEINEPSPGL
jgi:cytoskeletal protein CcmA (bactofilin family)